ncbi:serine protease [Thalassobaculum sp.]|uniref:S1 family peptidase n=1 Tax=Thalassobaculum sp. TaxID=2022740 RepID=UPI0032EF9ECF
MIVLVAAILTGALSSGLFRDDRRPSAPLQPSRSERRPIPQPPPPEAPAPEAPAPMPDPPSEAPTPMPDPAPVPRIPEVPGPGAPLPAPSDDDPSFGIELEPQTDGSGTAFSVGRGLWMTARHAAGDCRRVAIVTESRRVVFARETTVHPNADLAVVRTTMAAEPVSLGGLDLRIGDIGFHFGFPHNRPGAVRSSLLGRRTMRLSGRYSTREPILVWAEAERRPDHDGSLEGISGGPVFDAAGQLVGVDVAGSSRRGRVYSAAPESIREMFVLIGWPPSAEGPVPELDAANFVSVGERLRAGNVVARVACRAK